MGLDLWYNKGVKRGTFKGERGKAAGKSTPQSSRKNLLTNTTRCGTI
nr:MAG TPA: hypothetical protein [Bacteriophage sp.]